QIVRATEQERAVIPQDVDPLGMVGTECGPALGFGEGIPASRARAIASLDQQCGQADRSERAQLRTLPAQRLRRLVVGLEQRDRLAALLEPPQRRGEIVSD